MPDAEERLEELREKEMERYAQDRNILYAPTTNIGEGSFALWTATREGVDARLLRDASGVELWTTEVVYEGDQPVVYEHIEGRGELAIQIELLREVTDHRVPITVRITGGDIYKEVMAAVKAGVDGVAISVHDISVTSHPMGLLGLFPPAARAMHDSGGREDGVLLMIEGEFHTGADMYKAMAMGADAVGVTSPALEALEAGSDRLNVLFSNIEKECLSLMGLAGHATQETLSSEDLAAVNYETGLVSGLRILGYEKELPIWLH